LKSTYELKKKKKKNIKIGNSSDVNGACCYVPNPKVRTIKGVKINTKRTMDYVTKLLIKDDDYALATAHSTLNRSYNTISRQPFSRRILCPTMSIIENCTLL
jgi:hypothetical protein